MWQKVKVLLWKVYILRKRHIILTLLEVLVPIAIFWLVVYYRNLLPEKQEIKEDLNITLYTNITREGNYTVAFTPSNNFTETIMKLATAKMETLGCNVLLEPKREEEELVSWLKSEYDKDVKNRTKDYLFWVTSPKGLGVIFLNTENINNLTYILRTTRGELETTDNSRFGEKNGHGISKYEFSGFLTVQAAIDQAYLTAFQKVNIPDRTEVVTLPYVEYSAVDLIHLLMPTIVSLGFTFVMPSLLKEIVEERTSGIKEMMKIMGLRPWMNWLSWTVYSLVVYIPVSVVITVLLTKDSGAGRPVESNFIWVFGMFLLFTFAFITLIFTFSTFFTNGTRAMIIGELVWYGATILLDTFIVKQPDNYHIVIKLLSCLWPSIALVWSFNNIHNFHKNGQTWSLGKLFDDGAGGGRISVGLAIIMLIVDMIVYSLITWYMENVKPGPFGRAKPFTFIFKHCRRKRKSSGSMCSPNKSPDNFEPPPKNAEVGIQIINLYKTYCNGTLKAVKNVNLDIYKGSITVLLGHNGAGKTSLMSMLAGFFSPTRGEVVVNGRNIFEDMDQFRSSLGLCPQHNLLFSYFTVLEHLIFFGMLKGFTMKQAKKKGKALLKTLKIYERRNYQISKLSGGMKRKVSLAIALTGDPEVVLLDEPTSGMDPESRRQVWDILLNVRGTRTTVITTHFMEEADVLGDRVVIMNKGQVSCYGTPIFLKKLYGTGFHLHVSKLDVAPVVPIAHVVERHTTISTMRLSSPSQLSFNIKVDTSQQFPDLFSALDKAKESLGLTAFSISSTTMEDVFLRIAGGPKENKRSDIQILDSKITKVQGGKLMMQQIKALVYKRMLDRIRGWIRTLTYIVCPVLLMAATTLQMMEHDYFSSQPLLKIELSSFPKVSVAVQSENQTISSTIKKIVISGNAKFEAISMTTNLQDYMIGKVNKGLIQYERVMIAGFETQGNSLIGGYSHYFDHSYSLVLNMIANTMLQMNNRSSSITIYNYPIPVDTYDVCDLYMEASKHVSQFPLKAIFLSLGLLILSMSFISFPLNERVSNLKQLQLMSGVPPLQYWLVTFICDFVYCLVAIALMVCMVLIFQEVNIFTSSGYVGTVALVLMLYVCSGIPFAYFFSFFVKSAVKATVTFAVINIAFGLFGATLLVILEGTYTYLEAWRYFLSFNPLFSATAALIHLFTIMYFNGTCLQCGHNCTTMSPFEFFEPGPDSDSPHGINNFLIFLAIDAFIYFGLVLLIEYGVTKKAKFLISTLWIKHDERNLSLNIDSDVKLEAESVHSIRKLEETTSSASVLSRQGATPELDQLQDEEGLVTNKAMLHVYDLGKKYDRKTTAVHGVTFQVRQGECFGLLGINGAGKTTTFKMLTGEELPSKGDAEIYQYSLKKDKSRYLFHIGYCPQFDPISEVLTSKEMLHIFALLRGIPTVQCNSVVSRWIQILGMEEFANRPCGTYSGGNKRKLSTAIAFIGSPPVVFLDEPTCGVDPVSRRRLWDIVRCCQKTGQAIVLTSHSMEECEALCSRLTIMVGGQMKCLGSPQYLKNKFGQGYTIKIKMNSTINRRDSLDLVKADVVALFQNCELKDEHLGLLHYFIPLNTAKIPLGKVFKAMEHIKKQHGIVEDYSVNHTSLEEVFMAFARQRDYEQSKLIEVATESSLHVIK